MEREVAVLLTRNRRRLPLLTATILLGGIAGCKPANEYQEPPPPKVQVAEPLVQDVTAYLEITGTTAPVELVDIRARVSGFLEEIHFMPPTGWTGEENATAAPTDTATAAEDAAGSTPAGDAPPADIAGQEPRFIADGPGSEVKKGDRLYTIEQKVYIAALNQAEAALTVAKAESEDARAKYERAKPLAERGAVSPEELFEKLAAAHVGQAKIEAAKASVEKAQLDLDYTTIRSPINGRVGKTLVDRGNLVGETEATHLTTVVRWDEMYANFNISERALLELRAIAREREMQPQEIVVLAGQEDEKGYPHKGHLDYADLAVDTSTGTFMMRAIFDNSEEIIVPGAFVRIRIPLGVLSGAIAVPERAVGSDQRGRYLLAVDSENTVVRRDVVVGAKHGEMILIKEGLQPGERIIVEGLQRARPGAVVDPQTSELAPSPELIEATPGRQPEGEPEQPVAEPEGSAVKADDAAASAGKQPTP
jgi:membrane fusion protein (multidrug efflux system)